MQEKQYSFKKYLITYLVHFVVFVSFPAYSAPLQTDGSTPTTLDKARNNVPIVNIATPNASGLSHNKFTQYNVNKEGLILNNAKTSTVNTQLGGDIYGNAQLKNNARLILNEVTSTSRSMLNGYTEIAGTAADLVIANPNGLSINGAGFINTNNITLTTGRPSIVNGRLNSLTITGGDITIMGNGLNTQGQSSTSIYTQYLKLNAKLHANKLDIKLGGNTINYQSKNAVANGAANTRAVLLDTSALGGMYAGRISLVGTDKGLGVNLPPEVLASTGNIRITNDGTITLQKVSAEQQVNIHSAHDIVFNNNVYSGTDIVLGAGQTVAINGGVTAAKNSIIINSGQLINQATIIAGLQADNTQNAGGVVGITSSAVANNGQIQSTGKLNIVASSIDNTNGIGANNQLSIKAVAGLNNSGTMHANQNSQITTGTLTNSGTITASNQLDIKSGQLTSTGGKISATNVNITATDLSSTATSILAVNDLNLNVTGTLSNTDRASRIQAGNNLFLLNTTSLTNRGLIAAGNNNSVNVSQSIHNEGTLYAKQALFLTALDVTNTQRISSDGSLSIRAANSINNTNALIDALGDTLIRGASLNNTHANLLSGKNHDIVISGALTNAQGVIKSNQNSTIKAASLDNTHGRVEAVGNLTLQAADIVLTDSKLYAGNDFSLSMNSLDNITSSSMGAGNNLSINAVRGITNRADLLANGNVNLITQGSLTNNKTISSGGALHINARALDNASGGTLSGGAGISQLNITDTINNQSRISAMGDLDVTGSGITNNGFFNAGHDLTLTSTRLTNNQTLFAGNNMNLYTTGMLTNNPNANIFTMNNLTMAADIGLGNTASIVNDQANIESLQGNIDIYASSLTNRTNMPVIQGTYVPTIPGVPAHWVSRRFRFVFRHGRRVKVLARGRSRRVFVRAVSAIPEHIVGGKRLSTVTKTKGCGGNCKDVITTTVDTMVLTSSSAPATINAGGNLSVNANSITNQYSLMSAGGSIHLASKVVDNLQVNIMAVTTTHAAMYRNQSYCKGINFFGCLGGTGNRMAYVGTKVSASKQMSNTVAATIQAGGSITGNLANLTNGNIRSNQTIAAPISQTASTATMANPHTAKSVTVNGGNIPAVTASLTSLKQPVISLPKGHLGLFIVSPDPASQYLIETNPAFTIYNNFISSNYMLQHIKFSPERTIKRVGDDFYENKLIRDSIFAQTGRRFLRRDITSDYAQYKYLMDNALKAQADLQLVPGMALTATQVAALNNDIVWLVEQQVAGQKVLVPVVYIVNAHDYKMEGGKIIAGDNIDLAVNKLQNSGLMDAGNNLAVTADTSVINKNGSLRADNNLSLQAKHDIENISADMTATNITLVTLNGDIINKRYIEEQSLAGDRDRKTVTGAAGSIAATGNLALTAGQTIAVTGSKLSGQAINLKANKVAIDTTVKTSHFTGAAEGISLQQDTVTHLGSSVEGGTIAINTSGTTSVSGSRINAKDKLAIHAAKIDVLAVNNSRYEENRTTSSGFLSHQSKTTKQATSTSIGSQLSGGNVTLTTTKDDITVVGSEVSAKEKLALDSAKNIDVQAGFNGAMNETHTKKSGLFTGGALYSNSENLAGKLSKTAVLAKLSGNTISLTAKNNLALKGVDVTAIESLHGAAQNISVENVNNEVRTYSKHEKMTVGLSDIAKALTRPDELIKHKDGKLSVTLVRADISKADKTTTTTTVVGSNLKAGDITLSANSEDKTRGNVRIKGSNLTANNGVSLTASNNVTIKEAKNTKKTASKDMKGTAVLNLTAKNEYVQINYAVQAAKQAKNQLTQSKQSYDHYKQDLTKQRARLLKLKSDLANGKTGIEQADVDEMASLIDDLKGDDTYYKANIVLATANLASKTVAVASQMAKAASAPVYGFSASLELDIDALEKKFNAYKEQSVASNVTAKDININAGSTATVWGSNLNASNQIDIAAKNTNILASQDVNNSSNSKKHAHLNISYGTSGGLSASASADHSHGSSDGITNHNSQLVASNININTHDTTTISGANVSASGTLNIKTKNLDVASVQDSQKSRSSSAGFSVSGGESGVSGAGANMGMSHSRARQTVLTTLTGNRVNIAVGKDTKLKGATVAAVDKNGTDNGQLNLKTGTLEVSSLNNTRSSKSLSAGVNVGIASQQQRDRGNNKSTLSTVSIDYSNDRANSKTKTLGTIGKGSIDVASVDKSNTKMLNRDVKNNTVDIYNIKSHRGLKGTVDTRIFTRKGRAQIKKEFKDFGKNMQTVAMGLPKSDDKKKVIAVVGEILDTLSKYTGGIVPSHGTNGGLLGEAAILAGSPDITFDASTVPGAYDGKKIYINGVLNYTAQDAQQGADNIIGKGPNKAIWPNLSHGAIADLLESAVDILNGIGLQTGISKQVEHLQQINHDMKIYMHSQGHLIAAEGARHSKGNGNTYFSYGAPMSDQSIKNTFSDDKGNLKKPQKNEGDYVAHPLNIFKPSTWNKPGHGTENYGASKAAREAKGSK